MIVTFGLYLNIMICLNYYENNFTLFNEQKNFVIEQNENWMNIDDKLYIIFNEKQILIKTICRECVKPHINQILIIITKTNESIFIWEYG
jgi:hypothetical protein